MHGVSGQIEAGALMLPEDASWLAEFVREIVGFPGGRFDDQADALTQLMNWGMRNHARNNPPPIEGPILIYVDDYGNLISQEGDQHRIVERYPSSDPFEAYFHLD